MTRLTPLQFIVGTADPAIVPPASFNIGDYYRQLNSGGDTVGFFQYNGSAWARINTVTDNYKTGIVKAPNSYVVTTTDYVVIYQGSNAADTVSLPAALDNSGRTLIVVNQHSAAIAFTTAYKDFNNTDATAIAANSSMSLQSDGTNWIRIE